MSASYDSVFFNSDFNSDFNSSTCDIKYSYDSGETISDQESARLKIMDLLKNYPELFDDIIVEIRKIKIERLKNK